MSELSNNNIELVFNVNLADSKKNIDAQLKTIQNLYKNKPITLKFDAAGLSSIKSELAAINKIATNVDNSLTKNTRNSPSQIKSQSGNINKTLKNIDKIPMAYAKANKQLRLYSENLAAMHKQYNQFVATNPVKNKNDEKNLQTWKANLDEQQKIYDFAQKRFQSLSKLNDAWMGAAGSKGFVDSEHLKQFRDIFYGGKSVAEVDDQTKDIFKDLTNDMLEFDRVSSRITSGKQNLDRTMRPFLTNQTDFLKYEKSSADMFKYLDQYGKALKKAGMYERGQQLYNKVNNRDFSYYRQAAAEVSKFRLEARLAGVETKNFMDIFGGTLVSRIRSAMAGMSVFAAQTIFLDLYNNVKMVDSAMTELKKVTDGTSATYDNFLNNASKRAKSIGATLTETINASADYARLGYNIDEASQLADTTLIYSNVGDDLADVDQASSSIISTMQGFHIAAEDSMQIVDKFNAVNCLPLYAVMYI